MLPKTTIQILAQAVEYFAKVVIHAALNARCGVDEAPLQPGLLDVARQFEIFHDFVAHGRMALDLVVGRTAEEQELADRRRTGTRRAGARPARSE